jgi:hypothetical protein
LQGGHGGLNNDGTGYGGDVNINGGAAGTFYSGSGNSGAVGGNVSINGGVGNTISTPNVNGGGGGNINIFGGSAGALLSNVGNGNTGDGGYLFMGGGNGSGNQATGSGGNGGGISLTGGDGGQSFAGRAGGGGSVAITAGRAGVGSAAKPFHSGNTIADGGTLTLQGGSPSAGFTNYTSGAAGNIFIYGGRLFNNNKFVSGSRIQIGASGSEGSGDNNTTFAISRIFINAPVVTGSGFPGTDIFFYVSGSTGGKGVMSGTVSVFGGDVFVSGNTYVKTPTSGTSATNKEYVDFPTLRLTSGSSDSLGLYDVGCTVAYPQTGSVLITLINMNATWPVSRSGQILLQFEHSASLPIISCSGATLNGSSAIVTASAGFGLISLSSRNGTDWYR